MNVKVNNWVMRVGYPVAKEGFTQTYENVLPCSSYPVVKVSRKKESITIEVIVNGKLKKQKFWAGNFSLVKLEKIIDV